MSQSTEQADRPTDKTDNDKKNSLTTGSTRDVRSHAKVACSAVVVVLTAAVFGGLSYWLYTDVPPGLEQSEQQMRWYFAKLKLVSCLGTVGHVLGVGNRGRIIRALLDVTSSTEGTRDDSTIHVANMTMADVPVRLYRPVTEAGVPGPAVLYFHGGAWSYGSLAQMDSLCRRIVTRFNVSVVAVDYRQVPEVRFPVPVNDCWHVTKYVIEHASEYNVDPNRVTLFGDDAGANLALSVSLRLRDGAHQPPVKNVVVFYPSVQALDFDTKSFQTYATTPLYGRDATISAWGAYAEILPSYMVALYNNTHVGADVRETIWSTYMSHDLIPADFTVSTSYVRPTTERLAHADEALWRHELSSVFLNQNLAPLQAVDLGRLPHVYVITAQHDVMRDEGYWLVLRMRETGSTPVTHSHVHLGVHGFLALHDSVQEMSNAINDIFNVLAQHL